MSENSIIKIRRLLQKNIVGNSIFTVLCAMIALLTFLEPNLLGKVIDSATGLRLYNEIYLVFVVIIVFLLRMSFTYLKNRYTVLYRCAAIRDLSSAMLNYIIHAKVQSYSKWNHSYLVARIIDEPMCIDGALDYFYIDGFFSILICVGIIVIIMLKSWVIGCLSIAFIIADYLIAMKLPLKRVYKEYNESQSVWKGQASNIIQGVKVIKLGNKYDEENLNFRNQADYCLKNLFRKNVLTFLQRTSGSVCRQFGYIFTILISALMIVNGSLDVAGFTMLISLNSLLWSNIVPVENLIPMYKYAKVSSERILEILNLEQESLPAQKCEVGKIRKLEFKDVKYSYNHANFVLKGVNFIAEKGQITTITGYSGCGKSTILDIILGFNTVQSGDILLNDTSVDSGGLLYLRRKIGYVGQNTFLFNRTIRENLLYYVEENEVNINKMNVYLEELDLKKCIEQQSDGADTLIEDNSSNISGGEKQRLCLIRELMKEPEILILDEFTSHLDQAEETKIFNFLRQHAKDIIIIQVAHRQSAISKGEIIYVVDDGTVIEQGTHSHLLNNSQFYNQLLSSIANNQDSAV